MSRSWKRVIRVSCKNPFVSFVLRDSLKNSKTGPNFCRECLLLKHRHRRNLVTLLSTVHSVPLGSLSFPLLFFQTHPFSKNHVAKWQRGKRISPPHNSPSTGKFAQVSQCFSVLFCYTFITSCSSLKIRIEVASFSMRWQTSLYLNHWHHLTAQPSRLGP